MTKRPANCADPEDNVTGSILVWNGLVSRVPRRGGEGRIELAAAPDRSLERERDMCARGRRR